MRLEEAKLSGAPCPQILGLDEHFFTRRSGFATTLCDLKHRGWIIGDGFSGGGLTGKSSEQLVEVMLRFLVAFDGEVTIADTDGM